MGAKASVNLILHAHSPYVRHLEYPKFLEENWLFESLCESYIPLLRMLMDLRNVSSGIRLSICFSPTLCTMLCALSRCLRCFAAKWPIGNPRKVRVFGGCDVDAGLARIDAGSDPSLPFIVSAGRGERAGCGDSTRGGRSEGHAG